MLSTRKSNKAAKDWFPERWTKRRRKKKMEAEIMVRDLLGGRQGKAAGKSVLGLLYASQKNAMSNRQNKEKTLSARSNNSQRRHLQSRMYIHSNPEAFVHFFSLVSYRPFEKNFLISKVEESVRRSLSCHLVIDWGTSQHPLFSGRDVDQRWLDVKSTGLCEKRKQSRARDWIKRGLVSRISTLMCSTMSPL